MVDTGPQFDPRLKKNLNICGTSFSPKLNQLRIIICWELTSDGLESHPRVVEDSNPLNTR